MTFPLMGIEAIAKDIDSFERDMGRMKNSIMGVEGGVNTAFPPVQSFFNLLGLLSGAALAAGAAIGTSLVGGLTLAIKEASEAERVWALLAAGIDAANGTLAEGTQFTIEQAQALAMQFRDLAGGSDEAIASIIDMAVRMGNITADQMPKFIQTTLDLAAATGMDAAAAARLLAQAQEDPISTLTRFRKLGIQFTKDQEAQIKELIKSGKVAEAFALIMDRVGEATGGKAAAMAETFSEKLEILKNHIGETFEEIGNKLLPILTPLADKLLELADKVGPQLIAFFEQNLLPAIQTIVGWLNTFLGMDFSNLQTMLPEWVVNLWEDLNTAWNNIVTGWNENLKPALEKLAEWWDQNGSAISTAASGIGGALLKIASDAIVDGFKALGEGIEKGLGWITEHKQEIIDGLDSIHGWIETNGDTIKRWMEAIAVISLAALAVDLMGVAAGVAAVAAPYVAFAAVAVAMGTIYDIGEKLAKRDMTDADWQKLAPSEQAAKSIAAAWQEIGKSISGDADSEIGQSLNATGRDWGNQIFQGIKDSILDPIWGSNLGSAILTSMGVGLNATQTDGILVGAATFWANLAINIVQGISNSLVTADWSAFGSSILTGISASINIGAEISNAIVQAMFTDFINNATLYADLIVQALIYLFSQVKNSAANSMNDMVAIGKSMIDGIIKGIKEKINDLIAAVTEALSKIPQAAKDLLGIASPSKLFEGIGENVMKGFAGGMEDSGKEPVKAMKDIIANVSAPPAIGPAGMNRTSNVTNEKNILEGANIYNNTEFDIQAFAEVVRGI
jgi:hypothetical protein